MKENPFTGHLMPMQTTIWTCHPRYRQDRILIGREAEMPLDSGPGRYFELGK